jgi:hypothetical protein
MRIPTVVAVLAAFVAFSAAADHRKPGQWEITVTNTFPNGAPPMPSIPPEKLAQMKAAGVNIPPMLMDPTAPHTIKQCLTPEQAAKDDHPDFGRKDCQVANAKWDGSSFSGDITCKMGQGTAHGHVKATMTSSESYTATTDMTATGTRMGDFSMTSTIQAKWLGADCPVQTVPGGQTPGSN